MVAALWWLSIVPIALFTGAIVYFFVPLWVTEMPIALPNELLFGFISNLAYPRWIEQSQYLAAVFIPCILFLILGCFFREIVISWSQNLRRWDRYFYGAALLLQVLLAAGVIRLWRFQEKYIFSYFGLDHLAKALWIGVFALAGVWFWQKLEKDSLSQRRWFSIIPYVVFSLFCFIQLLGSVFTEGNLPLASSGISAHLEHTFGEVTSVFYGKTPWVDYFPQYQVVLPYLVWPYFKIFGSSIFTFTVLMSVLSFIGLSGLFWTLCRMTRNSWIALVLAMPVIYFGFYSYQGGKSGAPNAFNYYAMWPFRFILPSVTLALLVNALEKLSVRSLLFAFFFGALGMINNIDFGLPALVGCFAAVIISDLDLISRNPKVLLKKLLLCMTGVGAGIFSFIAVTWLRSGRFPNPIQVLSFQKAFGLLGFYGSSLPQEGAFQLVFFAFIASFLWGTYLGAMGDGTRIQKGILIFNSVFGCGAFMYFITRPHPENLQSFFVPWSFAVSVLLWQTLAGDGLRQIRLKQLDSSWLRIIPALVLLGHYFIFMITPTSKAIHTPALEIARMKRTDDSFKKERMTQLQFLQSHLLPNEKVSLMMPYAEWYAAETHVKNVFTYGQLYSLFLKEQADQVVKHFLDERIEKVFMVVANSSGHFSELKDKLKQNHFEYKEKVLFRGWLALEYWEKQKS